jgi:hypothetical protein
MSVVAKAVCRSCGDELIGRQALYCSHACRMKDKRHPKVKVAAERSGGFTEPSQALTGQQEKLTEVTTGPDTIPKLEKLEPGPQPQVEPKSEKSTRGRPFKPGNPWRIVLGGRQPGAEDRANKLSVAYGEVLEQLVEDGSMSRAEAIAQRMAHIATVGKPGAAVIAAKEMADRSEGKPMQSIQISQVMDQRTAQQLAAIAELLVRNPVRVIPVIDHGLIVQGAENADSKLLPANELTGSAEGCHSTVTEGEA